MVAVHSTLTAELIARSLWQGPGGPKLHGQEWQTHCPCHPDKTPSCYITQKNGPIQAFCQAGCNSKTLWADLCQRFPDLRPSAQDSRFRRKLPPDESKRRLLERWKKDGIEPQVCYPYTDELGVLLYETWRCWNYSEQAKTFRQCSFDPEGFWKGNIKGIKRVLYNLPAVRAAAKTGKEIWIAEGEKDCERLKQDGLVATTNVMGAGQVWLDEYTEALMGAFVYAIPDNDYPGYQHVIDIGRSFQKLGHQLFIIELPGLAHKGDVSDWLDGCTVDMLLELRDEAVPWSPSFKNPWPKPQKETKEAPIDVIVPATSETSASEESGAEDDAPICELQPQQQNNVVRLFGDSWVNMERLEAFTDSGNGIRFQKRYGGDVKHINLRSGGIWLVWDGMRFKPDDIGAVRELAKETARAVVEEVTLATPEELQRFSKKSLNCEGYSNMLKAASSLPGIAAVKEDFDKDYFLLNTQAGVLDLETGKLHEHDRKFMMSQVARCGYDPAMDITTWLECIKFITGGDEEFAEYLQMLYGYWMTADTGQQEVYIIYGAGQNLKSTYIDTVNKLLGDYGRTVRREMFMKGYRETQQDNWAQLYGLRMVAVQEIDAGDRLDEARIKVFAGGSDELHGRKLYEESMTFENRAKLVLRCNHLPKVVNQDKGIWRRLVCIPFTNILPDERVIHGFEKQIQQIWPGICAWGVEGAKKFLRLGRLPRPPQVQQATKDYKEEMDFLGRFLEEGTQRMPGHHTLAKDFQAAFKVYCTENNVMPWRGDRLGRELKDRGIELGKSDTARLYKNIVLRPEYRQAIDKRRDSVRDYYSDDDD